LRTQNKVSSIKYNTPLFGSMKWGGEEGSGPTLSFPSKLEGKVEEIETTERDSCDDSFFCCTFFLHFP
jgi:hypothetical protein